MEVIRRLLSLMIPVKKNDMSELIEAYFHKGDGYNPFFIRKDWQVAQLNYMKEQDQAGISKMDMHLLTDEIFILLRGSAVLIGATDENSVLTFECKKMLSGITYNIPVNTWHNIAMDKDASVIIVEKSNTHLGDFVFRVLNENESQRLNRQIFDAINEK